MPEPTPSLDLATIAEHISAGDIRDMDHCGLCADTVPALVARVRALEAQVNLEHRNWEVASRDTARMAALFGDEQQWAAQVQRKVNRYRHALDEMKGNCCMGTPDCHCIRCETVEPISHTWPQ